MFSASVVKTIDVLKECVAYTLSCVPSVPPDQFGFEGFEEGLDDSIVITIALSAITSQVLDSAFVRGVWNP